MSSLKTMLLSLILASTSALPARAFDEQPAQLFAACVGRLSAEMEFQWLMNSGDADVSEARRAAMLDLLAAAMEPGQERQVLATRIAAKQAHSALLTRATFNEDAKDAAWAASLAQEHQSNCLSFLLS